MIQGSAPGFGGTAQFLGGRIDALELGRLTTISPLTSFSLQKTGAFASPDSAGSIGGDILRRFTVVLDYRRKQLVLRPNQHFMDPYDVDMSGLALVPEGDNLRSFRVASVASGSPGDLAGIHQNDMLKSIDDHPASEYSLDEIRHMFMENGREYQLEIVRNKENLRTRIRLRRMI